MLKGVQQVLPEAMPGHKTFQLYPHDLKKAKELIAAADPAERKVTVWTDDYAPNKQAGEYYEGVLREIGLLLGYDATKDLPLVQKQIETPITGMDAPLLDGKKLVIVPILRDADQLSFAEIEKSIGNFAARARAGTITMEELTGGTFTITNGGVFGSLLSTPIVNSPQSAILGMHKIQERPVAVDGQVVVRPMMYIALTYDHRIIDGREAVQFLVTVKQCLEDPARMVLGI